jgi:hypothetical protein
MFLGFFTAILNTYLGLINVIRNMGLIILLRNISPPSWHKLPVLEMTLFSFELEVTINSDVKGIEESAINIRKFRVLQTTLTTMCQHSPIHQEGFFPDEGMPDIQPSALRLTWHQCPQDHDPDHLV